MISPLIQADDKERVRILELYNIHGTEEEAEYDAIAQLANSICDRKISLVSFIDMERQWFKAHAGTDLKENSRELALCSHTINDLENATYIPDTRKDMRFKFSPVVTGPSNIQFYAGVPILSPEGYALGTVCVMDHVPKKLTRDQLEALVILKTLVQKLLEMRRARFADDKKEISSVK
ncbi:MAG: GAF domain-containing protein [Salibacteraceae bacterium]|nr:GAF domain-containing protein [Salibacteraceae bacterium]MDP4762197.1 GAF domain-containing protein [Salibacteraceae bacterium]MDP4965486.1 GAF domain-containing protein [Salibacteraceae bacterium]